MKDTVAGCRTVSSKTLINKKESELEKRQRLGNEIKALGNECFKREGVDKMLKSGEIEFVFISHEHLDHQHELVARAPLTVARCSGRIQFAIPPIGGTRSGL